MSFRLDHGEDALNEVHEINVTPFIDVMLVLLIIFMVAAPLATTDIKVKLPAVSAELQPPPDEPLYLTVKSDLSLAKDVARRLRRAMESMPSFRNLMFAYIHAFLEQVLVSVACNGARSLKERLARWLLMMRDRSDKDALPITQKSSRRNAGCSEANHHECCPRAGTRRFD
jgi:biopolymer transport protein ExbD/TolR